MKLVQRRCARVFRVSSQSRRRAQCLATTWPTNTGEPFSPCARLPAAYPCTGYSSNWSPSRCRPASKPREPQARPLAVASAHRPVPSPLAPPLPGSAPHLIALPVLATRVLAWRLALRCITDPSPHTVATALLAQPAASLSTEPSCCSEHAQRPPPLLFKHAPAPFCLSYSILH